ncbi:MAG: 3-deoxy-8-phosphooctulonate synthase [Candidatus Riflebacteria bacterium]|nr:3-deoxy-8-phosphooctulonate synthase [Candidatus Riflebacteria bacterium]
MVTSRKADTSPGDAVQVRTVQIGDVTLGGGHPVAIIAGPDVLEDPDEAIETARQLKYACGRFGLPYIFKASYDKANRADTKGYRGPMLDRGLELLGRIRETVGCPVLTDVHSAEEARQASEVVDVLQLPAHLCLQTTVTLAIARTGKAVNIKKGQFIAPRVVAGIARKVESEGNSRVFVTERGTTFGYSDLVADFRTLPLIRSLGYPVVLDPTHIIRYPGISSSDPAGGEPEYVPHLCRAAVAAGCDGLFIETHPEPRRSRCDACSMFRLAYMPELLDQISQLDRLVKRWDLGLKRRDEHGFV